MAIPTSIHLLADSASVVRHSEKATRTTREGSVGRSWIAGKMYCGNSLESEGGKEVMWERIRVRVRAYMDLTIGTSSSSPLVQNGTSL